jgi:hypothetical protein
MSRDDDFQAWYPGKKGGTSMGYVSIFAASLVVAGLLVVPRLSAEDDGGAYYREPPMVKTKTVIVADDGGGTDSIGILDCLRSPWICI